jgi:hypothetical protein
MFDKVWQHFVVEEAPESYDLDGPAGGCAYRGPIGNKCALGLLIPDHLYRLTMESEPAYRVLNEELTRYLMEHDGTFEGDPGDLDEFASRLQDCHDDHAGRENFRDGIRASLLYLAADMGLQVPA